MALALWTFAVALACLAGAALFRLAWPEGRRRASCTSVFIAAATTGGVATFFVIKGGGPGASQLDIGIAACMLTTLALLVALGVGDRARGRRRCPRCWYTLGETSGRTCPECGKTARSERALLRARRPKRVLLAALTPLVGAAAFWCGNFFNDHEWPRRLPSGVLALCAPLAGCDTRIAGEIKDSLSVTSAPEHARDFTSWQRWLLVVAGRRAQADSANPSRVFYGVAILFNMDADDEGTTAALAGLTRNANANIAEAAAIAMGHVTHDLPAARRAMYDLIARGDPDLTDVALMGLYGIQSRDPGGALPGAIVDVLTKGRFDAGTMVWLLRNYEPHPAGRTFLTGAAGHGTLRANAIVTLAALWPDDDEIRRLVLEALREEGDNSARASVIEGLVSMDRETRLRGKSLSPARLALYTPEISTELERAIPELERERAEFMRENPDYVLRVSTNAQALRESLDAARKNREDK